MLKYHLTNVKEFISVSSSLNGSSRYRSFSGGVYFVVGIRPEAPSYKEKPEFSPRIISRFILG
jgi:hypothetical protein